MTISTPDLRRTHRATTHGLCTILLGACLLVTGCAAAGEAPTSASGTDAASPDPAAETDSTAAVPQATPGVLQMTLADRQTTYDFGYVAPLSKHTMTLVVRNTLPRAVTIRKIVSECTCMSADVPATAIPAGGEVRIPMDFTAPKQASVYSKRLLLWTSEPTAGKLVVRATARVALPLDLKPVPVEAGELILQEWRGRTLTISNDGDTPVRLTRSESTHVQVSADVAGKVIPARGAVAVPVVVKGLEARDSASSLVTIRTDCPTQGQLVVPVTYTVLGDYKLSWGSMDLGEVRPGERRQVTLTVTAQGKGGDVVVRQCRFDSGKNVRGPQPTVETAGAIAAIKVDLTAGTAAGPFSGEIVFLLAGRGTEVRATIQGTVARGRLIGPQSP